MTKIFSGLKFVNAGIIKIEVWEMDSGNTILWKDNASKYI